MTDAPADGAVMPVLPRRFRPFFFFLTGLLGLQLFAVAQAQMALIPRAGGMGFSVPELVLMALLLLGAAMALVHDGSAGLCARVSLVAAALELTAPLYAARLGVPVGALLPVFMMTLCLVLPAMVQAGPVETMLRRLTFGVGLALGLMLALLLVTWGLREVLRLGGVGGPGWRVYVPIVAALPVWVRLMLHLRGRALPELSGLAAGGVAMVPGEGALSEDGVAGRGGTRNRDGAGLREAGQCVLQGRNRLSALMLLTVGVLVVFCWRGVDPMVREMRGWAAGLLLLLFLVCYAPSVWAVVRSGSFWLGVVLLPMMRLFHSSGLLAGCGTEGWMAFEVLSVLVGCLLGSVLMRVLRPWRVAGVCMVAMLAVMLLFLGKDAVDAFCTTGLSHGVLEGMNWVLRVLGWLVEYGVLGAVVAVAYCGLMTCVLRHFSARLGGVVLVLLYASLLLSDWLVFSLWGVFP